MRKSQMFVNVLTWLIKKSFKKFLHLHTKLAFCFCPSPYAQVFSRLFRRSQGPTMSRSTCIWWWQVLLRSATGPFPSDLTSNQTSMSTSLFSAACDSQCLTCDMAGVCTSCRDPAKVLLFGECQYDSCAHQYYLNTTTRACRGTPPSPWQPNTHCSGTGRVRGNAGLIMRICSAPFYDIHKLLSIHIACSAVCYIEFMGSTDQVINCGTRTLCVRLNSVLCLNNLSFFHSACNNSVHIFNHPLTSPDHIPSGWIHFTADSQIRRVKISFVLISENND